METVIDYGHKNAVLGRLLLVTALWGCGDKASRNFNQAKGATTGELSDAVESPIVCVIAIDGTRSYQYLDTAKGTAADIVRKLPGGSIIFVRWITEDSMSDACGITSAVLPLDPAKSKNPFNMQGKVNYTTAERHNAAIRKRVVAAIENAVSPEAQRTDIWGALSAASRRFAHNPAAKPRLYLLTDMVDNVGRKCDLTLNGVHVSVLDYQIDPGEDGREGRWTTALADRGAGPVHFYHPDEVLMFNPRG